jgi:hypothetical protein
LGRDDYGLCTKHPPNTVVAEFEEDGVPEILVFVMSAWADSDLAPLGGYHMYRVSHDGGEVLDHFSQTRSCPVASSKELQESDSLMVSHIDSATPTMFHVFMSLQYRKPIYVATTQNDLLWKVDRNRIELLKTPGHGDTQLAAPIDAGNDGKDVSTP